MKAAGINSKSGKLCQVMQKKILWAETSMVLHKSSNTDIYSLTSKETGWETRARAGVESLQAK